MPDSLFHAQQSHSPRAQWIESTSIILHAEEDTPVFSPYGYLDGPRLGVLGAIVQCLLHHAVDAGRMFLRKFVGDIAHYLYSQAIPLGYFSGLPIKRRLQSEVIQH